MSKAKAVEEWIDDAEALRIAQAAWGALAFVDCSGHWSAACSVGCAEIAYDGNGDLVLQEKRVFHGESYRDALKKAGLL